jgi:hypothetical protein
VDESSGETLAGCAKEPSSNAFSGDEDRRDLESTTTGWHACAPSAATHRMTHRDLSCVHLPRQARFGFGPADADKKLSLLHTGPASMTHWSHCPSCDLKHTSQPDNNCPRCGAHVNVGRSDNPFATPQASSAAAPVEALVQEGSLKVGIVLGFVFGLWGMIGAAIFAKPQTKRGALYGMLGRLVAALIIIAIANA